MAKSFHPFNDLTPGWTNSIRPYTHADVVESYSDDLTQGCAVVLTKWKGMASAGYKTNFERRPVAWLIITVFFEGKTKTRGYRYSGKTMEKRLEGAWKATTAQLAQMKEEAA